MVNIPADYWLILCVISLTDPLATVSVQAPFGGRFPDLCPVLPSLPVTAGFRPPHSIAKGWIQPWQIYGFVSLIRLLCRLWSPDVAH